MTWVLESAKTRGDVCYIIYSETTQDEKGSDVVDTQLVKHYKSSSQTNPRWYANIRREIAADLSDLNKTEPAEVDITSQVEA